MFSNLSLWPFENAPNIIFLLVYGIVTAKKFGCLKDFCLILKKVDVINVKQMKSKTTRRSDGRIRAPFVTPEQRSEFYRLYHSEGQPIKEIAEKYGVKPVTVSQNIAKFADEIMDVYKREVDMGKLSDTERIKALEKENRELRTLVAKSELKAKFFETMVDIAEKNFNIPIKKKAGTKPPEP